LWEKALNRDDALRLLSEHKPKLAYPEDLLSCDASLPSPLAGEGLGERGQ